MGRDVTLKAAAREKLIEGINFVADAVKQTLGPQGGPIFLEGPHWASPDRCTKDGVTVAKDISCSDQRVNMGCNLVKSVAGKAVELAGDGTTTATILAQALSVEGHKMIVAGMKPQNIKKGIEKAVVAVVENLKSMSIPVSSNDKIKQIGTISANGDEEVGIKIAEAMEKVGKEGILTIEESRSTDFEVEVVHGMRFDKGYISPYFVTNGDKMVTEFHKPFILLLQKKLALGKPLEDVMTKILNTGRPVLLIAEDYEPTAIQWLVTNKVKAGLQVCAVKAPLYGNFMQDVMEDIATLTQGKVYVEELGIDLQNIPIEFLGGAEKVIITNEHTTIVHGHGKPEDIEARCEALRAEIKEKKKERLVTALEQRLARLTGGIAVLRVGGLTEMSMKERKDRVEDAVHATKAAVEEGIVPGGGVALFNTRSALDDLLKDSTLSLEVKAGIGIVKAALSAPLRQIVENAGESPDVVASTIDLSDNDNYGYDACSMEFVDMIEAGIIDPTKVVRIAIQAASDIAVLALTAQGLITEDRATREEMIRTAILGKHK